MNWTESLHCKSRAHCKTCLINPAWRKRVGAPDVCPHGVKVGVGDRIASYVKPIAQAIDKATGTHLSSGCGQCDTDKEDINKGGGRRSDQPGRRSI